MAIKLAESICLRTVNIIPILKLFSIIDAYSLAFRLQEIRDEYDDFQEGSRELEAELEAQLEQSESRIKELLAIKQRLEEENETLKVHKVFLFCHQET